MSELSEQPHREMCDFLEDLVKPLFAKDYGSNPNAKPRKGLLLVPRGTFKTSLGVIGLAIHCLERNPNLAILIDMHNHEEAKSRLQEIKGHIDSELFIQTFGDWKKVNEKRTAKWSDTAIIISRRTRVNKDASIDTAGIDKSKNGGHFDLIICDDLHDENNTATRRMRDKVSTHIHALDPILNPGGTLLIIGTRWHADDAYGRIIKKDDKLAEKGDEMEYKRLIRGAFIGDDQQLYFPSRLNDEFLADKRKHLPSKLFSVWYLNQAKEDADKVFPIELMSFWEGQYIGGFFPLVEITGVRKFKHDTAA